MRLQLTRRLAHRGFNFRDIAQRVEQAVVMDHPVVAYRRHVHAGCIQLAGIGLAFIAQYIQPSGLYQCRWQAGQLRIGGPQWRGVDLGTLLGAWPL